MLFVFCHWIFFLLFFLVNELVYLNWFSVKNVVEKLCWQKYNRDKKTKTGYINAVIHDVKTGTRHCAKTRIKVIRATHVASCPECIISLALSGCIVALLSLGKKKQYISTSRKLSHVKPVKRHSFAWKIRDIGRKWK